MGAWSRYRVGTCVVPFFTLITGNELSGLTTPAQQVWPRNTSNTRKPTVRRTMSPPLVEFADSGPSGVRVRKAVNDHIRG